MTIVIYVSKYLHLPNKIDNTNERKMIINNLLNEIFSSKNTVKVLRELEKRKIGFTGSKIATFSKITHQSGHNILTNLH